MAKIDSRVIRVENDNAEIQQVKCKIANVASNKNVSINYGTDDMVDVLDNIDNGTIPTPSGTLSITSNNTYDVTNYASADVNVVPSLQNKAITITENGTTTVRADAGYDGLNDVEVTTNVSGGGVSTQSQSIFTGYTAPLTWLNSTNNVFKYESATHNITITGLSSVATITGNGTKSVTVTIDTSSSSDRQTAFTISCTYENETLTYNGIEFHYGSDVASGNCLAVAQTLVNGAIGYIFIESNSLPSFSSNRASWNMVYSHQIISFDFGKWSGTSIGGSFLGYCYSFNQPITIPNTVTSIGSSFLSNCSSFNQPITIPNTVTSIDTYFLQNSRSFNQPLDISNVTSIGNSFLQQCSSFNQPLDISNVTSIGNSFLQQCSSFNQPITIPNTVTSIGNSFLQLCFSFNQPITIPNTVTSIGSNFLQQCFSFIYLEYNASVYPTDNNSLSQTINTKTSSGGTGIKVVGTGAEGLKSALPNMASYPYRKLV